MIKELCKVNDMDALLLFNSKAFTLPGKGHASHFGVSTAWVL